MSLRSTVLALGIVLAATTPAAYAQYSRSTFENPVQWYVDGGFNVPVGSSSDLLRSGWNFGGGVIFRQPGQPFGLRFDFNYSNNEASSHAIYQANAASTLNINGGWADIWSGTVNGEYRIPVSPQSYGYVLAGVGVYYANMQLTEVGTGFVCNPWWGYCYIGTGSVVVASRATTKFGWNLGAGLSFQLQGGSSMFVEARYTWLDTSHPSIEYIPVLIGVRF